MITAILGSVVVGRAKQIITGPFGAAILASMAGLILVLATAITFHVATGRAASTATQACVSAAEADRLNRVNAALKDAVKVQDETLRQRREALRGIEERVAQVEKERNDALELASKQSNSCSVVFGPDDPWLRPQPARKPGSSGR